MATKTFSSRVDEEVLRYADSVSQRDAGMSFGQFCGTRVAQYIFENGSLPKIELSEEKKQAFSTLRGLAGRYGSRTESVLGDASVGLLDDGEIKELIASRYA